MVTETVVGMEERALGPVFKEELPVPAVSLLKNWNYLSSRKCLTLKVTSLGSKGQPHPLTDGGRA